MAGNNGAPGTGQGRRMPVQQTVDIGAPIENVYNQWTQFEEWPTFMQRVTRVTQEDECTVSFATKIWGKTKEFTANIETQRPNARIKWSVSQGMTHTGVVTFHELGPNLTRVMLTFDVLPGSLIEKAARGMRHVKRAARADLHRFKALIELAELETGAWRGRIEDGELVEEHDPRYDEQREYSDVQDLGGASNEQDDDDRHEDEDQSDGEEAGEEEPKAERSRRRRRSRNGSQGDEGDEGDEGDQDAATPRTRSQSRASSASRASRSRSPSGSRSGSSSRSHASRGSGRAQASGRRTPSRSGKS